MTRSRIWTGLLGGALLLLAGTGACASGGSGAGSGGAAASPAEETAGAGGGGFLYVPNQADATISVVALPEREVVETVDLQALGYPPNAKPHDVIGASDGSAWYVSLIGANRVVKFDAENRAVGEAGLQVPGMLALSPDDGTLYVGRSMSAVNPPQRIGVVNTADMSVEQVEVLFPRPHAIAAGPEGNYAHSASLAVNRLATLESSSGRVSVARVDGPTHVLVQFAVSPDGSRLVATGQESDRLLVFDRTRPEELPLLTSLAVGQEPWHPVFTPDGRYVVFGNKADDTVTIVDTGSWEVAAVVEGEGLSQPHGAVAGPEGRFVYVTNNNLDGAWTPPGWTAAAGATPPGNVAVVDVEARSLVGVIPVGHDPNGLGFRPVR